MVFICLGALNFFITYNERAYIFIAQNISPEFVNISAVVFFFPGLFLLEFVKAVTYGKLKVSRLHVLPMLVFVFVYIWHPIQSHGGIWQTLFWKDHVFIATVGFSLSAIYGIYAIVHVHKYADQLKQQTADINFVSYAWLRVLIYGFTALWLLEVSAPFFYDKLNWVMHNIMIHLKNIWQLALVSYVIYSNLLHSDQIERIPDEPLLVNNNLNQISDNNLSQEYSTQVNDLLVQMQENKYYRQHNLTIDHLAQHMNMSSRELSGLINTKFNKNFYEFVNTYRIEDAKKLLSDPSLKKRSIQLIYDDAGFHSKSSFNTLFKKHVGMTPSEFRKQSQLTHSSFH